ncbi:MAG: hypothetical protein OQK05_12110 [Pseudopelagicola sp.]|nr:hypothetical protein [Pseudopelagicola sp.]
MNMARNMTMPSSTSLGGMSNRYKNVVVAVVYSALLVALYRYEVSVYWSYMGFHWTPSMSKFIISFGVISTAAFLLPTTASARDIFLQLCLYFHFAPSLLIFSAQDFDLEYLSAFMIGTTFLMLFSYAPIHRVRAPQLTWAQVFWVATFFNLVVLAAIIAFSGVSNFSLSFSDVYEFRAESNSRLPGIFGYLRPATTKVMLPIIMILAFQLKNRTLIVATSLICVAYFAYSHHKVIIFASFTAVFLFLALKRAQSSRSIGVLALVLIMIVSATVFWSLSFSEETGANRLASIVARRSIFVPVLLDALHVQFFSENPFYYWSQSSVGLGLAERPFDINAPFMIGLEFFGNDSMSANTGYIGSGFANAGLIGVSIYGAIIGLVVSYLNGYGNKVGHPFVVAVSFTLIMGAMRGSDLPTIFMTHGLMLFILFLVVFPTKKELRQIKQEELT